MQKPLDGRVAIVTGGGGEIGGASARALAAMGARIAVVDLNSEAAALVVDALRRDGHEALAIACDVADESSVRAMVEQTLASFGRIDAMYAAAAALGQEMQQRDLDVATMDIEIWDRAMAVNLRGPMLCTKHILPTMLEQGSGSIIYASSGLAFQGEISRSAYSASKIGLIALARSVATQYGRKGIRANAIQTGFVPPIHSKKPTLPAVQEILGQQNLIPHILRPENIADVVAFLVSDASVAITGQAVVADGGFSAHTPTMKDMLALLEKTHRSEI